MHVCMPRVMNLFALMCPPNLKWCPSLGTNSWSTWEGRCVVLPLLWSCAWEKKQCLCMAIMCPYMLHSQCMYEQLCYAISGFWSKYGPRASARKVFTYQNLVCRWSAVSSCFPIVVGITSLFACWDQTSSELTVVLGLWNLCHYFHQVLLMLVWLAW